MSKIVYSCVVDNRARFAYQASIWATTLLQMARQPAGALVVHVIEGSDPRYIDLLSSFGVTVISAPREDQSHGYSNKIVQTQSERLREADYVVLCDCDIAFCEDITAWVTGENVCGKPVDRAHLEESHWRGIFSAAGLPMPDLSAQATADGKPTPPTYLNGGFLILPQKRLGEIMEVWPRWNRWLLERRSLLGEYSKYADQVSFALSLEELGLPVTHLSDEFNCPTHCPKDQLPRLSTRPKVLHYHDRFDQSGLLLKTSIPAIDEAVEAVNDVIRASRRVSFDNFIFWQLRYDQHPELGSGVGSRGYNRIVKADLLKRQVERVRPKSILDIGCGDLEVTRGLKFENYTGVDLSSSAIEQASKKRPQWKFAVGNALDLELEPHELVVCFDVVIHQPNRDTYERFCSRLLALSNENLLIAGYNQPPWYSSEITFYYEPLSETLMRLAGGGIEIVGGYRDTTVLLWSRNLERRTEWESRAHGVSRSLPRRALRRLKRVLLRRPA